jgi:hypothetical protein
LVCGSPDLALDLSRSSERLLLAAWLAEVAHGERIDPLVAAANVDNVVRAEKRPGALKHTVDWAQKWLLDNAGRVTDTIISETGKTFEDAQLAEISYGAAAFGFWAKNAPKYLAEEKAHCLAWMAANGVTQEQVDEYERWYYSRDDEGWPMKDFRETPMTTGCFQRRARYVVTAATTITIDKSRNSIDPLMRSS